MSISNVLYYTGDQAVDHIQVLKKHLPIRFSGDGANPVIAKNNMCLPFAIWEVDGTAYQITFDHTTDRTVNHELSVFSDRNIFSLFIYKWPA